MGYKRLSLWTDGHVMVEHSTRDPNFYNHVTPASYSRIEKLSWHGNSRNGFTTLLHTDAEGILFVSIDKG